jgi:hypothetical protein
MKIKLGGGSRTMRYLTVNSINDGIRQLICNPKKYSYLFLALETGDDFSLRRKFTGTTPIFFYCLGTSGSVNPRHNKLNGRTNIGKMLFVSSRGIS